jgi:hypothetical protein
MPTRHVPTSGGRQAMVGVTMRSKSSTSGRITPLASCWVWRTASANVTASTWRAAARSAALWGSSASQSSTGDHAEPVFQTVMNDATNSSMRGTSNVVSVTSWPSSASTAAVRSTAVAHAGSTGRPSGAAVV